MAHAALTVDVNPLEGAGAGDHVEKLINIDLREAIPELAGPVSGRARAYRSGTEIVVAGNVQAEVNEDCRLCLEPLPRNLELDLSAQFVPRGRPDLDPNSKKFDPDVGPISEDGRIDLVDQVLQTILAELNPFPDCQGSCDRYEQVKSAFTATSGQGSTIDPRLEPIRKLMADMFPPPDEAEDA